MHPFAADFPSATDLARESARAAQLLKDVRADDGVAAARFRHGHARFAWMTDEAIRNAARVTEARFVAAREYGFGSWARLREYVNALGGNREVRQPFETHLQQVAGIGVVLGDFGPRPRLPRGHGERRSEPPSTTADATWQ